MFSSDTNSESKAWEGIMDHPADRLEASNTQWSSWPGESLVCGAIPVARALGVLLVFVFAVGGATVVDGFCTAGMKLCFGFALSCFVIFSLWSILAKRPFPLTFSDAQRQGCTPMSSVCFSIYQGTLVMIVTSILVMSTLANFFTMKEFFDWSCGQDDDNGGKGWLRGGRR